MKSALSHAATFVLGLGLGFLVASKCPPSPTPGAEPASQAKQEVPEEKKMESKEAKQEEPKKSSEASPAKAPEVSK